MLVQPLLGVRSQPLLPCATTRTVMAMIARWLARLLQWGVTPDSAEAVPIPVQPPGRPFWAVLPMLLKNEASCR